MILNSIREGNIDDIKKYFNENTYELKSWHIQIAAKYGHLEIMKFLHEKGCPWGYLTTINAAKKGYLECLKYAVEHGCNYSYALNNAALNGKLDCIKYLLEKIGWTELDIITVELAAQGGHLDCIKYFHINNYTFRNSVLKVAIDAGQKKIEEYLNNYVVMY